MSAITPREIAGEYARWKGVQQWLFGWLHTLIALQTQLNKKGFTTDENDADKSNEK